MIFIAGSHPKTETYRSNETEYCFRCHNNSRWIIQKQQQFISLFFLPIIPIKTEYLKYCPVCGNTKWLEKQEFEQLIKKAERL